MRSPQVNGDEWWIGTYTGEEWWAEIIGPRASCLTVLGQQMAADNRSLAYRLAWADRTGTLTDDERVSIALASLVKAVQFFNPSLGFAFSTYAWRVIRHDLDAARWREGLAVTKNRNGPSIAFVTSWQACDEPTAPEPAEDPAILDIDALRLTVREALAAIPSRWRHAVTQRNAGRSLGDIAAEMGVSKERVRQMDRLGKRRLRLMLGGSFGHREEAG